ncbi:MAG: hypothetical protein RH860_03930 [Cytophagales bacterium]
MKTISRQSDIQELHKIYISAFRKVFSYSVRIQEDNKIAEGLSD